MQIIHGTWIPDEAGEFVQRGAFYVWVETDNPPRAARTARTPGSCRARPSPPS